MYRGRSRLRSNMAIILCIGVLLLCSLLVLYQHIPADRNPEESDRRMLRMVKKNYESSEKPTLRSNIVLRNPSTRGSLEHGIHTELDASNSRRYEQSPHASRNTKGFTENAGSRTLGSEKLGQDPNGSVPLLFQDTINEAADRGNIDTYPSANETYTKLSLNQAQSSNAEQDGDQPSPSAAIGQAQKLFEERNAILRRTDDEAVHHAVGEVLAEVRGNRTLEAKTKAWERLVGTGKTRDLWRQIEPELPRRSKWFTFIEWPEDAEAKRAKQAGYLSLQIAQSFPNSTVVSLQSSHKRLALHKALRPYNLLLSSVPHSQLLTLPYLLQQLGHLTNLPCTYQYLHTLPLPNHAFPHEVERTIGQLLALCQTTFLPSKLPVSHLSSYWGTLTTFLMAAADIVGLHIHIRHIDAEPWFYRSFLHSVDLSADNSLQSLCRVDVNLPPLSQYTSSSTSEDAISAAPLSTLIASETSEGQEQPVPNPPSTSALTSSARSSATLPQSLPNAVYLPWSFLSHVGLIREDVERLAAELLLFPESVHLSELSAEDLVFQGGRVMVLDKEGAKMSDKSQASSPKIALGQVDLMGQAQEGGRIRGKRERGKGTIGKAGPRVTVSSSPEDQLSHKVEGGWTVEMESTTRSANRTGNTKLAEVADEEQSSRWPEQALPDGESGEFASAKARALRASPIEGVLGVPSDFLRHASREEIAKLESKAYASDTLRYMMPLSDQARGAQKAFVTDQGPANARCFDLLHDQVSNLERQRGKPLTILTYGQQFSLMTLQLAYHHSTSLFVHLQSREDHISPCLTLTDLMDLSNIFFGRATLTPALLQLLHRRSQMDLRHTGKGSFDLLFLGPEALLPLLSDLHQTSHTTSDSDTAATKSRCKLTQVQIYLRLLLTLSPTSLLQLPSPSTLQQVTSLLYPNCANLFRTHQLLDLIAHAVPQHAKITFPRFTPDLTSTQAISKSVFVRIDLSQGVRQPTTGTVELNGTNGSKADRSNVPSNKRDKKQQTEQTGQHQGQWQRENSWAAGSLSLQVLMDLGLVDEQRGMCARLFLGLPLWHAEGKAGTMGADMVRLWPSVQTLEPARYQNGALLGNQGGSVLTLEDQGGWAVMEGGSVHGEGQVADWMAGLLQRELEAGGAREDGRFSALCLGSGWGLLSMWMAKRWRHSTVVSVEEGEVRTGWHAKGIEKLALWNNPVLNGSVDLDTMEKWCDSPEFVRYIILQDNVLTSLLAGNDNAMAGQMLGLVAKAGLSGFMYIATSDSVSQLLSVFGPADLLGLTTMQASATPKDTVIDSSQTDGAEAESILPENSHPWPALHDFQLHLVQQILPKSLRGSTKVIVRRLQDCQGKEVPMVRLDIVSMTRHVHHHYDYRVDGHTRRYTLHVQSHPSISRSRSGPTDLQQEEEQFSSEGLQVIPSATPITSSSTTQESPVRPHFLPGHHINSSMVASIQLHRDADGVIIPYTALEGITLIAGLRMGLVPQMQERVYAKFLTLPLYEDLASWNVLLRGSELQYIDHDTRAQTYDALVPKVYQLLTTLMNYKRTVADLSHCKEAARTSFGFAHVSDCVGGYYGMNGKCNDPAFPVPCADGQCHSDFISCLRSIEQKVESMRNGGGTERMEWMGKTRTHGVPIREGRTELIFR